MKWLTNHRCHDYAHLAERWLRVAKRAGIEAREFAKAASIPLLMLESRAAAAGETLVYLSSGVHGDEAGSACGLLAWAEANVALLKKEAFLIFPCLNPQGLMLNTRADHRGLDLNRRFHLADDEVCGPWQRAVANRCMKLGLCLHEDYDAQGAYVYELGGQKTAMSPPLLKKVSRILPLDPRTDIDGRAAARGVIRPRRIPKTLPGMPEAIELHRRGCQVTLTFETPSEAALELRIAAHQAFITSAIEKIA
ncbi:MAG: M14 family metallocarboxypeptidase [Verrucomicrobiaceae bacterium]|nr:M14 family metallocarboxypeptidase [Verrucomicrobiaceae bacterium]